jgi:hemerythrin-like metal-binding protein
MLQWNKDYSIGLAEIDNHHQMLFKVINKLSRFIQEGESETYLEELIIFLGEYAKIHFEIEEKYMDTLIASYILLLYYQ